VDEGGVARGVLDDGPDRRPVEADDQVALMRMASRTVARLTEKVSMS
jgi:hypothetical protein